MITMTTGKVQVTLQSPDLHFTHTHGAASGRTKVELDTRLIRWSSLLRRCPALMMTSWKLHTNQHLMACLSKGAKGLGAQVLGAMGAIGTIGTLGAAGAKGALQ